MDVAALAMPLLCNEMAPSRVDQITTGENTPSRDGPAISDDRYTSLCQLRASGHAGIATCKGISVFHAREN
jgi:hypothetical protein